MKKLAGFIVGLLSLFLVSTHAYAQNAKDIDNIVLVKILYKDGTYSNNETGGVLAQRAPDGSRYIITARHGFLKDRGGESLPGFQGVKLYSFFGKYIGNARVAFCEKYQVDKPDEWNIRHDTCILEVSGNTSLDDLKGFTIPTHISASPIALCHSGIASWEHGASGSPVFTNGLVLQGILSETYAETYMDIKTWSQTIHAKGLVAPERLSPVGDNKPVVVSSCGLFTPPSPAVLRFLGINLEWEYWGESPIKSGVAWENYSLPNLRGIHIKSDKIISTDGN